MVEELKKVGQEIQKVDKDGFDATVRSFGEMSNSFQAIPTEVADYSKKADCTRAFEQLIGAKSVEQAIEVQSQYAKKAYETYVAEMPKLGELYVAIARDASKPVKQVFSNKGA